MEESKIRKKRHGPQVDRESLASTLIKSEHLRGQVFRGPKKHFGLLEAWR